MKVSFVAGFGPIVRDANDNEIHPWLFQPYLGYLFPLGCDAYLQGFKFYQMGYAAAISYVLMAVVIVLSGLQIRLLRGESYEY